jgi:hypothetical protein
MPENSRAGAAQVWYNYKCLLAEKSVFPAAYKADYDHIIFITAIKAYDHNSRITKWLWL